MVRRLCTSLLIAVLTVVTSAAAPVSAAAAAAAFRNPVRLDAADPSVVHHDGAYLMVYTMDSRLAVVRSTSVAGLRDAEAVTVWTKDSDPQAPCCSMWAPELHLIDGRWYLYYSAKVDQNFDNLRNYVLESAGSDPLGPYTFKGLVAPPGQNFKALDGTVYRHPDGRLLYLWSCYPPQQSEGQSICIAPMSNPWTISAARTKISVGDGEEGCTVREGPVILPRNGTLNLVYSVCNYADSSYRLRTQSAPASADLFDPASWSSPRTILSTGNGVYGPGHNGFFTSPDGTQTWIAYHGYPSECGLACHPRDTYVQQVAFDDADRPVLGAPVSRDTELTLPAGDPGTVVDRYEAENAVVTNARVLDGPGASGGRKVGYIDHADSSVAFAVTAARAGQHRLTVRYANGWGAASHRVSVGAGPPVDVAYTDHGYDVWVTTAVTVTLAAGANTIRFTKGVSHTELDHIEVVALG